MQRIQAGFTELFTRLVLLLRNHPSAQFTLYWWRVTLETEPDSSRKCRGEGQGTNVRKMEDGKIHLDIRKRFSPWGWSNIGVGCREVVRPLFLEIFKHQLNTALSNRIQSDLCWAGVRVGIRTDSYQPLFSCHSLINTKGHFWTRYLLLFLFLPTTCISISTSTGCCRYWIHCTGWPSLQLSDT